MCQIGLLGTKSLTTHDNAVFSNDHIVFSDAESDVVIFFFMGLNTPNLDNINFDDDNFNDDDPETIVHGRFMAWCNTYKQHKACKKYISKEIMPVVWHPTKWWAWRMPEDEEKK